VVVLDDEVVMLLSAVVYQVNLLHVLVLVS